MVGRLWRDSEQAPELQAASQPGGVQVRSMEGLHLRRRSRSEEEREESRSFVDGVAMTWE